LRTRTRWRVGAAEAPAVLLRSSEPDALSVTGADDDGDAIDGDDIDAAVSAGAAVVPPVVPPIVPPVEPPTDPPTEPAGVDTEPLAPSESGEVVVEPPAVPALPRSVVVSRASGSLVVVVAGLVVGLCVGDVEVDGLPGVFELFGAIPPVPVPVWLTPSGVGCEGDVVGEVFGDVVGDVGDVVGDVVCAEAAAAPNVSARAAPRVRERLRMVELSCGGGSLVLAARSTGVTMRAEGKGCTRTACAGQRGNSRYEGRR
jgi:hypothetical protein